MVKSAIKLTALIVLTALVFALLPACSRGGEEVVVIIPERDEELPRANTPEPYYETSEAPEASLSPETTEAPTPTPAPIEERVLSGYVYQLNGGKAVGKKYEGDEIDLDGDGVKERLEVKKVDGAYSFCIDGEPFMADGLKIRLASPDGRRIMFVTERENGGFNIFYPDREGNLFCRLFAVSRSGDAADYSPSPSYEESIRKGLDIMLYNPAIYTRSYGAERTIKLDMDGDGVKEEIVFDDSTITINGQADDTLLTTTMPRFIYDAEKDTIILYGSSGGFAVTLRMENGKLVSETKYVDLL